MKKLDNNLTAGKSTKNIISRKGKMFGYQILGFGSGGTGPLLVDLLVVAGGGGGGGGSPGNGGGGGAGIGETGLNGFDGSIALTRTASALPFLFVTTLKRWCIP